MTDAVTDSWLYYVLVGLMLIPVYMFCTLLKFFGWKLFVNN
ncbi:uncharacterized protein LOC131997229 [Stomoxys calcitrans]|nr:uncharacterized protein LOC131997229 [Stomoxys calcitrans]